MDGKESRPPRDNPAHRFVSNAARSPCLGLEIWPISNVGALSKPWRVSAAAPLARGLKLVSPLSVRPRILAFHGQMDAFSMLVCWGVARVYPDKPSPRPSQWSGSVEGHRQHPPLPFSRLQTNLTKSLDYTQSLDDTHSAARSSRFHDSPNSLNATEDQVSMLV